MELFLRDPYSGIPSRPTPTARHSDYTNFYSTRLEHPRRTRMTSFAAFREYTSWKRPGREHGCKPVEIVPGLWTAHYHDIDSKEKLRAATKNAPIKLVINSALCQCDWSCGGSDPMTRHMSD